MIVPEIYPSRPERNASGNTLVVCNLCKIGMAAAHSETPIRHMTDAFESLLEVIYMLSAEASEMAEDLETQAEKKVRAEVQ